MRSGGSSSTHLRAGRRSVVLFQERTRQADKTLCLTAVFAPNPLLPHSVSVEVAPANLGSQLQSLKNREAQRIADATACEVSFAQSNMQGTCSEQSKESDKGVIWLHA